MRQLETEIILLEDDIRSLRHWKTHGHLCHPITKEKVGTLIDALQTVLSTLQSTTKQ